MQCDSCVTSDAESCPTGLLEDDCGEDQMSPCAISSRIKVTFNDIPEFRDCEIECGNNLSPTPKNYREAMPRPVIRFRRDHDVTIRAEADARRLRHWADQQLKPWMNVMPLRHDHNFVGSSGILDAHADAMYSMRTSQYHTKGKSSRWMVDSGSRFHLIDPREVDDPNGTLPTSVERISNIRLKTASGKANSC